MKKSELEQRFKLWVVTAYNLPTPEEEYRFHPNRLWRFDFAWPEAMVAVEIDGGQWMPYGGRHARDSDREKLNAAAGLGWRVLRYSGTMLNDPERVAMEIQAWLGQELRVSVPTQYDPERVARDIQAWLEDNDG